MMRTAALLLLLAPGAFAAVDDTASLIQASAGTTRRACSCLPWAEVYGRLGVKCGQGLEFYAWLGTMEARAEDDPKLKEVRYNLGDEFCTKFFERMNTNRAVRIKFNTPPSEAGKEWDKSWCYVNSECGHEDLATFGGGYVPGKPVHWKIAHPNDNIILKDMRPTSLLGLSVRENKGTGYDMGVLGGYAYYLSMGEDQDHISTKLRKETEESGLTTILQPANHLAPRMIVSGIEKWTFKQNTGHQTASPGSWWTSFKHNEEDFVEEPEIVDADHGFQLLADMKA